MSSSPLHAGKGVGSRLFILSLNLELLSVQFSSVAQSCLTL